MQLNEKRKPMYYYGLHEDELPRPGQKNSNCNQHLERHQYLLSCSIMQLAVDSDFISLIVHQLEYLVIASLIIRKCMRHILLKRCWRSPRSYTVGHSKSNWHLCFNFCFGFVCTDSDYIKSRIGWEPQGVNTLNTKNTIISRSALHVH